MEKVLPKKFSLVLMLDVLEHIEDDVGYLNDLRSRITDDGRLFITVPAFQRLYGRHDLDMKHFRRYDFARLANTLNTAGFLVEDHHYFYASLVIPRLFTLNKSMYTGNWQKPDNHFMTQLIKNTLDADYEICRFLSRIGLQIGGLSLYAVAKIIR